jgi:hypothetical protein
MGRDSSVYQEIRSAIESIQEDTSLWEAANFVDRSVAIDLIEFNIIGPLDDLLRSDSPEELSSLKQRAESLKKHLGEIDSALFRATRADIRSSNCTRQDLWRRLEGYAAETKSQDEAGYDALDAFINGLFQIGVVPRETRPRSPDMVFFQPTPARIILEMIRKAKIAQDDVFYDLGSGLGQVPILVNLLTGARAKGIEFEPVYCDYAERCANDLGLDQVVFANLDVRDVSFADGTVFFMYTPFTGELLQEVLEKLRSEAQGRTLRICAYGTCTSSVSNQAWLRQIDKNTGAPEHRLAVFESVTGMAQSCSMQRNQGS